MNQRDGSKKRGKKEKGATNEYRLLYCKDIHRREYCFNKCNDDTKTTTTFVLPPHQRLFLSYPFTD